MCGCRGPLSGQLADTSHKSLFFVLLLTNLNLKALSKETGDPVSGENPWSDGRLSQVDCVSALGLTMASVNMILCSVLGHFPTEISSCGQKAASWVEGRENWTFAFLCPHQLEPKRLINAWKRASRCQINSKTWALFIPWFSSRTAKNKFDSAVNFIIFSRQNCSNLKKVKNYRSATVSSWCKFHIPLFLAFPIFACIPANLMRLNSKINFIEITHARKMLLSALVCHFAANVPLDCYTLVWNSSVPLLIY